MLGLGLVALLLSLGPVCGHILDKYFPVPPFLWTILNRLPILGRPAGFTKSPARWPKINQPPEKSGG